MNKRALRRQNRAQADLLDAIHGYGQIIGRVTSGSDSMSLEYAFMGMGSAFERCVTEGVISLPIALGSMSLLAEAGAAMAGKNEAQQGAQDWLLGQRAVFEAAHNGLHIETPIHE